MWVSILLFEVKLLRLELSLKELLELSQRRETIGDAGEMGENVCYGKLYSGSKKVAYQPVHSMFLNTSSIPCV